MLTFLLSKKNRRPLTINKVDEKIQELYNSCFLKVSKRQKNSKTDKLLKLLNLLLDITYNSEEIQLKCLGPRQILPCSIKILSVCDEEVYKLNSKLKSTKSYELIKNCYYDLLSIYTGGKSQKIIKIIIETINQEDLWQLQKCCHDVIVGLIKFNENGKNITYCLLKFAETKKVNDENAKAIINILISIFQELFWFDEYTISTVINKLLSMYHSGINTVKKSRHKNLKDSLEVLLRIIIGRLNNDTLLPIIYKICLWVLETNVSEKYLWELGKIAEHAAYHYDTTVLEETLTKEMLHIFMRMINSSDPLINLLGNRIFQYLIDRNKNKTYFESPEIFFQDVKYDVKRNENHHQRDMEFLRQHRELIHDTLVGSVIKHSSKKLNLESTYCTICLLVVEIPLGFTAAAIVCLVMNIQKLTLDNSAINRQVSYHIHATVMAILSLTCWIHDAKILYAYVNKIMMKRAQWAPQLNPPLKTHYIFAVHYVRWSKPELFFINWEVRFGLWKCFRSIDKNTNDNNGEEKKIY